MLLYAVLGPCGYLSSDPATVGAVSSTCNPLSKLVYL